MRGRGSSRRAISPRRAASARCASSWTASPDVDAVFAANDLTASGALRVLRERGKRVPEDVAVVGFDDMLAVAEQVDPPLTTVRQDIEEMGRLMARMLLARGELPTESVVLPTELVRRGSA
ncbi:substrate-binding domain-containing protein [Streptomyces rectiviolaceus]|uniref:substrate-binding domain-containing protein n=1 Tax=Streptomyces rectiviolaceus TaxID=332591 RepID=UPI00363A279F